jgi:hypothetical protein
VARATCQFDHPAAKACQGDTPDDGSELEGVIGKARIVLACRNNFVATSMRQVEG